MAIQADRGKGRQMSFRVVFFPEFPEANPYWSILSASLKKLGVEVVGIGRMPFGRRWLWYNRHTIQVLHFHFVQQLYAYEGTQARLRWVLRFASNLLLARFLGYKTVFTLHNATPTYPLTPSWVDYFGHWIAVNLTDRVIVHCEAARQLLKEKFGRHRHVYIISHPNFIDRYPNTVTQSVARKALGINPENLVFTFVGGIRPNKGVDCLVAAFKQLEGANLTLVIAGKAWPPETHIKALEQSVKEDSRIIVQKRFIPDEELQIYFNAADVVVLPFERILTSSSVVLAMGFGRPIIVPEQGCLPEYVAKEAGILYDPTNPSGLLQALTHSQQIRMELNVMGAQAQQHVAGLTGRVMAEQTMVAYQIERPQGRLDIQ